MATSTSVSSTRVSRVVGYTITKGNFQNVTPNLPMRIAVLAEANTAQQGGLDLTPKEIISAQEAGVDYGYGSPIYNIMRILRPVNGSGGVGGIPVVVYPQAEDAGAVEAARAITVTGNATGNGVHTVVINGRRGLDGGSYDFDVVTGDTPALIAAKIADAINNVLGAPVIGSALLAVATATTKWAGLTAEELDITVDLNTSTGIGVSYAVVSSVTGVDSPDIQPALDLFGSEWNTIVVNSYGTPALTALEAFNGIPDPVTPTGRYTGIIMKPFVALFGSTIDDPSTITDARKIEVTNVVCPAPLSSGWDMEAAANATVLEAVTAQDTPHLDINAQSYPDMPVPTDGNIGSMSGYNFRDSIVKKGCTTVDLIAGRYQVQDFVTTYHPDGETPPQFRYVRNLILDFNVRFGYFLLEEIHVRDHVIATDFDTVTASKVIKPKMWKQVLDKYAEDLGLRALINDVPFMQDSIDVSLSITNPDRLDTQFSYKRSGTARISSTTAQAGFNFGNI